MYQNAGLCIKYDFWYLSIFDRSAVVVARGTKKEKSSLASSRCLMHDLLQSFCAIVGIRALNENQRCVSNFHLTSTQFNVVFSLGS